ncbi:hypothetical protein C463_12172 [Halorubrum californiense DSM 19288]|uniref:DNA polymerase sliding clamp n=1 Tax=Halorubrum californiense DSM 19288 TaxID=1227465 RepID=M0E3R9_9EURY|nr:MULTISPECIES: hypothetical protein [Halorubrum]ELZ41683.1 hypothetical protein C463_12172 [Halorubrum californiense DSM 19288]TKX66082.1 hypothetical protein EXE40_16325 [Halorubrum sp. GN11GM_10-3_MGM]
MWSWLPTQASADVSLRVTLDRSRLADLLAPAAAVGDEIVIQVTSDTLAVRAADDAHTRSVTATLDADTCSQYAVTPGRLAFDPTALRAAITADEAVSAESDPVTLAYATSDSTLSVSLPTVTHEQPVDPTPETQVPQLREWPGGATLHHRAEPLAEVCDYFAAIAEAVAVEYDGSRNAFRIKSAAAESPNDASQSTGAYERSGADLPGEAPAATVRAEFDSALLRDFVAAAPRHARLRIDIADAHPLRLGWPSARPDRRVAPPVEVTAHLAPREVPARDDRA